MPVTRKSELVHGSVCCKPRNRSEPAAPWTLSPCQVTVTAQQPLQFWEHVKKKAAEERDWDLLEKIGPPKTSDMQSVGMNVVCDNPMALLFLKQFLIQDKMIAIKFLHGESCKTSKQKWLNFVLILKK